MSLPNAPKDISSHPVAGSVVDPVNKQKKEADVDRKVAVNSPSKRDRVKRTHLHRFVYSASLKHSVKVVCLQTPKSTRPSNTS